ncbi:hypothetical protein POM88_037509 [Heracleum sosnowskyi]|uniref:Uncharacterized protein n=1 Tax=Heracleum sosnowskyi TaxID=360622 RepID=A0AAD8MFX4_9APIA|nr:hypothetical protein POM88_037509 [Heracleum sosnowskyi]
MALIAVTGIAVTFLLNVLQIMYQSPASRLHTNPQIMLIGTSTYLLYCFGCYLEHYINSNFRSSTWPTLVYTNAISFLGFVSMASFASMIFSTSYANLAFVYLLLAVFFSGKLVLSLIRNGGSFTMRRSNSYSNLQLVRVDVPRIQAFSSDAHTLPV